MNQNDSFDRAPELAAEEPLSTEQTATSPYSRAIELARALVSESDANQPNSSAERGSQSPPLSPDQFPSPEPPERPLFQSFAQPAIVPHTRIPHLGHLALLAALTTVGLLCSTLLVLAGLHFHLFGVTTLDQAKTDVHYTLGSTVALYLATFTAALFVLPRVWRKSFFAGIQWNGATALRLRWRLFAAAGLCFLLAMLDEILLPSPANAPIDQMFRSPGAAWLMLAFGVTLAPFFEEISFRGFLLPALATAWDWVIERATGKPPRPLDARGHPQWSIFAMILASILTSLPFALMHADQQGHALGPFLLLIAISLVLCAVRLRTRSVAASVLVHASYNFLLFSLMLLGTGGFRHLDKM
jgi:membrane protease YdiL (CAAX protease family)